MGGFLIGAALGSVRALRGWGCGGSRAPEPAEPEPEIADDYSCFAAETVDAEQVFACFDRRSFCQRGRAVAEAEKKLLGTGLKVVTPCREGWVEMRRNAVQRPEPSHPPNPADSDFGGPS